MQAIIVNSHVVTQDPRNVDRICKLEPASATARNCFGAELGYSWAQADEQGKTILVSEDGEPYVNPGEE
jgi:hypothetical protein